MRVGASACWFRAPGLAVVLFSVLLSSSVAAIRPATTYAVVGDANFHRTWIRTDWPVRTGEVARTWMWGPALTGEIDEPSLDAPGGMRRVQYFDKSRMEITNPAGDPSSIWYVTNGLLAKELITGTLDLGGGTSEQRKPAEFNVAGDPDTSDAPTYASLNTHLDDAPAPAGSVITTRVARDGTLHDDPALGSFGIRAGERIKVPGIDHRVASVFWEFLNQSGTVWGNGYTQDRLFGDPFYATGYPISEAYWAEVRVANTAKTVLVQAFERRVLTWTPDNSIAWRVEAGNVGRHYYAWRYGSLPPAPGPKIPPPSEPPVPPSLFMDDLLPELQELIGSWQGDNAVSVTDLQTGRMVSVNGNRPQPAACTIKIFIMIAIAQDIEAGKITESQVYNLVLSAMGPSNTPPAYELIRIAGSGDYAAGVRRVNDIMRGLGMTQSIMRHAPSYPDIDLGFGTGDNLLTANELNLALGKLYRGEVLSPWATQYVLWSMTFAIPGQQYSLGGGLPGEADLYHKIGLIYAPYNTWNDAGVVVFHRNGRDYAYAISYLGSRGSDWHDAYYHGADVSAAAWRAFSTAYP